MIIADADLERGIEEGGTYQGSVSALYVSIRRSAVRAVSVMEPLAGERTNKKKASALRVEEPLWFLLVSDEFSLFESSLNRGYSAMDLLFHPCSDAYKLST